MTSSSIEATQILQRLSSLKIMETPTATTRLDGKKFECYSADCERTKTQVPETPSTNGMFLTELKKRRKIKLNRVYAYETDQHFVKARKSLHF